MKPRSKESPAARVLEEMAALSQSPDPEARKAMAEVLDLVLAAFRDAVEVQVGDTYELKHPVTVDGTEHKTLTLAKEATTRVWRNAQIAAASIEEVEDHVLAEMYGVGVAVIWALWPKDTRELARRLNHFFS